MGGATQWTYVNGQRLTFWMVYILGILDAEAWALFKVHIIVSSGLRTYEEQKKIFLERYVTAANIRGRKVYDTRWWNGQRWYRISSAGTVAPPGSSNHEVQGDRGAWDLRDTGSDAGITVKNSTRGKWFRKRAPQLGIVVSGDGFGEGWHSDVLGIFRTPPTSGGGNNSGKRKKVRYSKDDVDAMAGVATRTLKPGEGFWLNTDAKEATSQATDIIYPGPAGEYSIVTHVYASGAAGDQIEVLLYRDNKATTGPHSAHFVELITIEHTGQAQRTVPSILAVPANHAVYARVNAKSTNKNPVKITRFATDALV